MLLNIKVKINILALYLLVLLSACGELSKKKSEVQINPKKGPELFAKYGCAVCHSLEGKIIYGPPLDGLFMKKVNVLREGKEISLIADREYLKRAIREPRFEKVLEYRNKEMPLTNFTKEETDILVDYLISLTDNKQPVE